MVEVKTNNKSVIKNYLSVHNNLKMDNNNYNRKKIYGWGNIQPLFLQKFLSAKWALFWLCWAGAMQGLIVNGFINVVITTIEKRFGLRSRQTGLVASGYDIASFLCLVPVTYFGGRIGASKPRWIGWGVLLMGIGSFTFALPHFLVGQYRAATADLNLCNSNHLNALGNGTLFQQKPIIQDCNSSSLHESELDNNLTWNVWFFFIAQLLHGAGASPLFTLGVTYIDENVSKKMSSVYLGIYYTMAIIGPAVGYVVGGQLLLIYTDFLTIDSDLLGLTSQSKVWIGAWWIGFIFAAIACGLLAIPIIGYPESLPGSEELQQEKISEAHNGSTRDTAKTFTKLKEIPRALFELLKNPTFFFLNLAGASEGLIIAGFAAFLPKQIENQFSISPVWSALLMGLITVPAGGGGTFIGGYLVKKLNLSCAGIIKLCLIVTTIATVFTSCFLLSCPNLTFAGVTSDYYTETWIRSSESSQISQLNTRGNGDGDGIGVSGSTSASNPFNLESACNSKCACNSMTYDPICGTDGVMYYSPCYAGCKKELSMDHSKIYLNCDCIIPPNNSSYDAINTMCKSSCTHLPFFVGLCFVLMLTTFLATMPALSATLRCVHDDQRSFALGIQWIKVRLLGTIPAPMIFGILIDDTCVLWQKACDDYGACLVYDNKYMSKYMWILALIGKTCSVIFFFGAWWFYIPPKNIENHTTNTTTTTNTTGRTTIIENNAMKKIDEKQQVVITNDDKVNQQFGKMIKMTDKNKNKENIVNGYVQKLNTDTEGRF